MNHAGQSSSDAGIDLSQFHRIFFEEAAENLENMERMLLQIDLAAADDEELNAVFRCAHSVKGGAAAFGFADVAELTHQMETLLDKLRRHELAPDAAMVDVLLQSGDALKALLARHQGSDTVTIDTSDLVARIGHLASGTPPVAPATAPAQAPSAAASAPVAPGTRWLELTVGPLDLPDQADSLVELFEEIIGLGSIEALEGGEPVEGLRRFKITTTSSDDELLDLFTFHVPRESVRLAPRGSGCDFQPGAPGTPPAATAAAAPDAGYGLFADAAGVPAGANAGSVPASPAGTVQPACAPAHARAAGRPAAAEATLRVAVDKVDHLINLVGELVITQSVLAQTTLAVESASNQRLAAGLADLARHTRALQDAVMSIRMIPMSVVFNRFPRMLRDLAAKLDKKVQFVTHGEATELDKGMIEKLTDPLTHLLRNCCDHGIEQPDERVASGKPAAGTVTLTASHEGGNIVIEVRDDGRGLNRAKLLGKAREKGIDVPDTLSDAEVWALIFAPGFSTAEVVTDVSGRGVGLDVVTKNIASLGGTIEIDSAEGRGMSIKVRLPLTLAIMDSMSVGIGGECYILPLASVVESFQFDADRLKTVGGSVQLVQVRDDYLPVIALGDIFDVPRQGPAPTHPILVVVEAERARVALLVDELLGQQQVVVKNLEANYRKVDYVSGATIMGDGEVALIIDVAALARRARH